MGGLTIYDRDTDEVSNRLSITEVTGSEID
jgi:hypothetical protein